MVSGKPGGDEQETRIALGHLVVQSHQGCGGIKRRVRMPSFYNSKDGYYKENGARNTNSDGGRRITVKSLHASVKFVSEIVGPLLQIVIGEDEGVILYSDSVGMKPGLMAEAMDEVIVERHAGP
jgi:hypothetical protein